MPVQTSALYKGTIVHRREAERRHCFRHAVSMAYIDLDELATLAGGMLVRSRPGLVRFRREDYLGDPTRPLGEEVRSVVREQVGRDVRGPVRMLTNLRKLGHCFNPVTFYFCFDANGTALEALVAQVTNTPWGERHTYVFVGEPGDVVAGWAHKELHVSPFMDMDQRYECRTTAPGASLTVRFQGFQQDGARAIDATLALRREPLSARALVRDAVLHPGGSRRVLLLIYVHAAFLRAKGVRPRAHP